MAIGEIFLTAFIQVLFEKLAPGGDLWNFAWREGIHTLLTKWSRMLEQIGAVLADAEEKQMTDQLGIKSWLEDLEDLAYDLDDVLDEFATEALRREAMEESRASTSMVCALLPSSCMSFKPSTIVSGSRMRSQIDAINARLQHLFERKAGLGLQNIVVGQSTSSSQRPQTSSLNHVPHLYGRDGDKNAITELLLADHNGNENVGVVPIVGMGGVGKTTLAQDVYNDEMVGKHFEMKAWVCVSEVFEIFDVTKAILESVTSETRVFETLDQVQVQLKKALAGKKFLIVLDDVWNENHGDWINLRSPFNDATSGSRVLVTTRNRDVALMMAGTNKFHSLRELSEDDCWFVFAQHAFENRNIHKSPNLESIGRKIVKKCGGLPLAARTLGGLLRCKERDYEWEEVLNSKMWELSDKKSDILPALRLSYNHLPSHLKKCFAYCSILPKDYEFGEKELVLWWMAEGLIQKPTGQKQMEDLGCEYFHELLSRSFFQPSSSSGEVSLFVMHDLINDLAYFVARRISFRLEEKLENNERDGNIAKARHSSYIRGELDGKKKFEAFQKAKNLRSFLPFGLRDRRESWSTSFLTSDVPLRLLPSLRRLRVLSLRRYTICELSSSIGDLKHVRFIDLSCALIVSLPESIGTLYNLQTLILRDCKNLKKLPANTSNLGHLRHLDVTGADSIKQMPPNIGKLTSLQTLSNFIVSQASGSTINELGSLIHLRGTLRISGLENVADALDAGRANLKDKQGLDVLLMKWGNASDNSRTGSVDLEVLDTLKPHKMIKDLTISGYHGLTFPAWVGNSMFCTMVSLKLQNCEKCISLPPLGQLPSLENLHVQGMKAVENVGPEFYGLGCSIPFPTLQNLTLEDMPEWKDWSPFGVNEEAQAFPRLSEISIKRCPKLLGKLPCNLPCLRTLNIEKCPLRDVLILDSFRNPEVGNETAVLKNVMHSYLSSLTSLSIKKIGGITSLWKNEVEQQCSLPALQRLEITRCPELISLFKEDREEEEGLQQQKQHEELPYSIMLEYFKIQCCGKLEKLPQGLHNLKSLRELTIYDCPCLVSFPMTGLPSTLRRLEISGCEALRSLPELVMLNCLEKLEVSQCPSLTHLGLRAGLPPNLKELRIWNSGILEFVIAEEGMKINCPSLETVKILDCESLKYLPDVMQNNNGGCLGNLSELEISNCCNLESIPEGWFTTTNLRELSITGCEKLRGLPHHVYTNNNHHLTSLKSLVISSTELICYIPKEESFTNLTSLTLNVVDVGGSKPPSEWGLHRLSSLTDLWINGYGYGWASFPPEDDGMMLCLPPSLIHLTIAYFTNLEKLSCRYFQNMHSLELLQIWFCYKLTTITELAQLPSLLNLEINYACPVLKQHLEKGKGQYWPLISHLPRVTFDFKNVFDPSS